MGSVACKEMGGNGMDGWKDWCGDDGVLGILGGEKGERRRRRGFDAWMGFMFLCMMDL